MTFTAVLDAATNPRTLKVSSDFRVQQGSIQADSGGQATSTTYTVIDPLTITDSLGHAWTFVSDDGKTAVYNY